MRRTLLLIALLASTGCFTEPPLAADVLVRCADDSECPDGLRCAARAIDDGLATCRAPTCGDGVVDAGEACDDGLANSDVVADACRSDCQIATCGDGVKDGNERCELFDPDCRPDCTRCGDGVIDAGEACDDGLANNDFAPDACRAACVAPRCGDGVPDGGEACDTGDANSDDTPDACRTTCVAPRCGDGVIDDGEVCDDGNNESGDGLCAGDCNKLETCGDGIVDPLDACDDANDNPFDGCDRCIAQTYDREVVVGAPITAVSEALGLVGHIAVAPGACATCTQIFVTAAFDHAVYRVELRDDAITSFITIAGTGTPGDDGDGGPATLARLDAPLGVAFDARRNRVYIADANNGLIRAIDSDGTIRTVAGRRGVDVVDNDELDETQDRPGLTGPEAILFFPTGLELEPDGSLLIAEEGGFRVRRLRTDGTIELVAGCPFEPRGELCARLPGFVEGHCVPSRRVTCTDAGRDCGEGFSCVDVDVGSDDDGLDERTCVVRSSGPPDCPANDDRRLQGVPVTFTFRDTAERGATSVRLGPLNDPAVDDDGTVYWVDSTFGRILAVRDGRLHTVAGSSRVNQGFAGDGGDARAARLAFPTNVLVRDGDLLIVEHSNHLIRRVDLDSFRIDTVAGQQPTPVTTPPCRPLDEFLIDGFGGPCATARPGNSAEALDRPLAIALDDSDDVIVTELGTTQIRRIEVDTGAISGPLLGGPIVVPADFGPATSLDTLTSPGSIAFDPAGRLHVFEWDASVATDVGPGPSLIIRQRTTEPLLLRLDDDGTIERVAGGGDGGDGPALDARLQTPGHLAFLGDDDAVFLDGGTLRRLRGGTITTVAMPPDITGLFSLATEDSGAVVVVDNTLSRVLRVAPDDTVTVLADRSDDPGLSFFYEAMATSAGVVHVLDLIDSSGGNFSTFDVAVLRVDTDALTPVAFDDTAFAADLDINTFVVTGLIDDGPDGLELTVVRHAAHEIRRYFADGGSVRIAGNGREPCTLGPIDDDGRAGPECDTDGDGLSGPAEVDEPAADVASADAPLRLNLRINVTFPGLDDFDPRTPFPRRAARQEVLQQATLARTPDGALVVGEQPTVAIGVRPGVVSAPLLGDAARLRRIDDGRLRTIVGPMHPPGPGLVALDAGLYNARALVTLPDGSVLAGGDDGRLLLVDDGVTVVAGGGGDFDVPGLTPAAELALPGVITGLARQDNLLLIAGHDPAADDPADDDDGIPEEARVLCPRGRAGSGSLVLLGLDDLSDPGSWRLLHRESGLDPLCGATATDVAGRFAVAWRDRHCVTSWSADEGVGPAVAGTCDEAGRFGDFLFHPGAIVARGDTLFVADLGNARLVRVRNDDPRSARVVVGADATTTLDFDLLAGQLAFDGFGNLGVASLTVVRQLQRVLDDDDENDAIRTIYGQNRAAFPELSSFCLAGLASDRDDDGVFVVSDACQRFLVRLLP